jgi:hypothetical protein
MRGNSGGDIHTRAGIMASAIATPQYFRFCLKCLQEDSNKYGETYWHRLHQIPGVLFCPSHKIPLQDSKTPLQGFNKHEYYTANPETCYFDCDRPNYSSAIAEKLITLAQDVSILIEEIYPSKTLEWFTKRYQTLLIVKGYANTNGRVQQKKLIDDFVLFYGKDFLETLDSI